MVQYKHLVLLLVASLESLPQSYRNVSYCSQVVHFWKQTFDFNILIFSGIFKNEGPFEVLIDISQIKELHTVPNSSEVSINNSFWMYISWKFAVCLVVPCQQVIFVNLLLSLLKVPNGNVVVGAGVSLNTFIHVLDQMSTAWNGFKVMADHVRKVILIFKECKCMFLPALSCAKLLLHLERSWSRADEGAHLLPF